MKFIISERQYNDIFESYNKDSITADTRDYISKLCKSSKNVGSPSCRLKELRNKLSNDLRNSLNESVRSMHYFFGHKNVGLLPKILELSLEYEDRTVSILKTIAKFIDGDEVENVPLKRKLRQISRGETIPDDLEDILKNIRETEYTQYENSFVGEYFDSKRTGLGLNYKCGEESTDKFIDIIDKLKQTSDENEFTKLLEDIKSCIIESLESSNPIKIDVVSKKPLYVIDNNGDEEMLFSAGSKFEIKMMDTNIDSYLSEFFSIFKQSDLSSFKPTHLDVYNHTIDKIFTWIEKLPIAETFIENLSSNMDGLIYDDYTIIPSKFIQFYWSNLGQRGCKERRLSIRFRINPELRGTSIPAYVFDRESDVLKKIILNIPKKDTDKIICR